MLKSWPIINGYEIPLSFLSDRTVPSLGFHVSFLFAGKRDSMGSIYHSYFLFVDFYCLTLLING